MQIVGVFHQNLLFSAGTDRNEIMAVRGSKTLLLVEVKFYP